MEWELSKENIQPRRGGRKPETLGDVCVANQTVNKAQLEIRMRYVDFPSCQYQKIDRDSVPSADAQSSRQLVVRLRCLLALWGVLL